MNYRSSNAAGRFVHFGGDVLAGCESSNGVMLYGGSTGGKITPVGDDANISLTIEGKGTGGIVLANSSQPVTFSGSSLTISSPGFTLGPSSALALVSKSTRVAVSNSSVPVTINGSSLTLGAAAITIGTSGASVMIANSTAMFKGFHTKDSTVNVGVISSGAVAELTFASTTFDVMAGDLVSVSWANNSDASPAVGVLSGFRLSTVATSRLTVFISNPGSTASTASSGTINVTWCDLT